MFPSASSEAMSVFCCCLRQFRYSICSEKNFLLSLYGPLSVYTSVFIAILHRTRLLHWLSVQIHEWRLTSSDLCIFNIIIQNLLTENSLRRLLVHKTFAKPITRVQVLHHRALRLSIIIFENLPISCRNLWLTICPEWPLCILKFICYLKHFNKVPLNCLCCNVYIHYRHLTFHLITEYINHVIQKIVLVLLNACIFHFLIMVSKKYLIRLFNVRNIVFFFFVHSHWKTEKTTSRRNAMYWTVAILLVLNSELSFITPEQNCCVFYRDITKARSPPLQTPVDNIWAMMTVRKIRGRLSEVFYILYCVYDSCTQCM